MVWVPHLNFLKIRTMVRISDISDNNNDYGFKFLKYILLVYVHLI